MSNTVITNYTDLNGPSTKTDSSVVVIVNKDGSLSVDQNLLGTLMGTDGSQGAGISVVRVGHEGRPDDATDSENDDDKVPHVTLSVDSYYDEPNSIIKYDSGAEMLQSLRIETRENSLVGFQNDHCYTPLTSPSQGEPQRSDSFSAYDDPVIEITHTPPPKPVPQSKKITILEQQILPKGKKIVINPMDAVILKGNDVLSKPLPVTAKSKQASDSDKGSDGLAKTEETTESSSISSGDSIPDRDSDSDYKDTKDKSGSLRAKRSKLKPRILKSTQPAKILKLDPKVAARIKSNRSIIKKEIKDKIQHKTIPSEKKQTELDLSTPKESLLATDTSTPLTPTDNKNVLKQTPKQLKKEKKTPAHVTALLSDMTSLFSTPDVIRRVSTDGKPVKADKEIPPPTKKASGLTKPHETDAKIADSLKILDSIEKPKNVINKTYIKQKDNKNTMPPDKASKVFEPIPQLDDVSLAQILQDTTGITQTGKVPQTVPAANTMNSPGLAGPLSPTLDLLGGLQPEEEGLTEDLLMHVAQLVESSENLQEVIDKQVLGKVDTVSTKIPVQHTPFQPQTAAAYQQTPVKTVKNILPRKDPIEIVRRDGRVITLPPIEAPATRSSKRKSQMETSANPVDVMMTPTPVPVQTTSSTPEPQVASVSKQYINKRLANKKQDPLMETGPVEKISAESQESWNSEDDPFRLWCICKQPHNNRFMICCDSCEDWFHGKCVNITKAMGQQMEEQGIEWRCPNCVKKTKVTPTKTKSIPQKLDNEGSLLISPSALPKEDASKTSCIVCKKSARASSIYCSDACILKHAQDSLGSPNSSLKMEVDAGRHEKAKSESRVIVYERKSGRLLAGPNAPTAENLKAWLQKNPTFEVVRPGTLSTIKPNTTKKKSLNEPKRIQTTLNFERVPRKSGEQSVLNRTPQQETKERPRILQQREEAKLTPQPKTPVSLRSQHAPFADSPKPSTSTAKPTSEPRKPIRATATRSQSAYDKAPSVSPSTSRRKESLDSKNNKMDSADTIRENVKKALQEQMNMRMSENTGPKFTEGQIRKFAIEAEAELYELFNRDVGMKYKAKYRSLMFNIKDRKNLSLWQRICDGSISPKQLVRLSPEELASQELAQWRDKETKHQLELIKKSELDLLAASKTYVLKTHKGEEVMETKEAVSTELDPSVPVEDVVSVLNDATVGEEATDDNDKNGSKQSKPDIKEKKHNSKRTDKDISKGSHSKKSRESKKDSDRRKSRSSRRRSELKDKEERATRRSDRKSSRERSVSQGRSRKRSSRDKSVESERLRHRSRSPIKSKRRSKSREHTRSTSQGRERSQSGDRSKRRSRSKESPKRRRSSRSKRPSMEDKHRSRSQENIYKTKNDSTDSDSIERPKSAMLKESHPEYDPHEPMITSAFSEEDLRKSGNDSYEDNYKIDIGDYADTDYDPSKAFSIDSSVILSPEKFSEKPEKVSETESDQEPSSTVDNSAAIIWNGCINMVDVARFYVAAHEISGNGADLEEDLSAELDIVGRINPDTVWDYIGKMKKTSNKDIIILKLQAANDEEKMQYIALFSYLSSRNRLGVVKVSSTTAVKDFYIVPLAANSPLPSVLQPLDGPGLTAADARSHLLLAIVIRQRRKRTAPAPATPVLTAHINKDVVPAKVARESRKRSYTPPIVSKSSYTPPSSPRRRNQLPLPSYKSPALSSTVKDKIAASLACADDEQAYSPGSSSSGSNSAPSVPPASNTLRSKMEELNRQIEEQKQQIMKMTQVDSSMGEDEAYSPSRPMTPPHVVPLADIALPSNLQEILATIKQRSETSSTDVDMRNLPLP